MAGGKDPPVCWCPPRCGAPLRAPRGVVCPPMVGACPVCCPPLRWALAPCAGAPPRCCGPNRDHCYDRREATALDASIRSLHGDTRGAATHTPTGRVSGGLGRRTPSSTARSKRSVQSAEQWCSSQSQPQPQPQLRYQQCPVEKRAGVNDRVNPRKPAEGAPDGPQADSCQRGTPLRVSYGGATCAGHEREHVRIDAWVLPS